MFKLLVTLFLLASFTNSQSQKVVSYKFEKEISGQSVVGGRVVGSVSTDYIKTVKTIFEFDSTKRIIKINQTVWEITSFNSNKLEIYKNSKIWGTLYFLPSWDEEKKNANQIRIEYNDGTRFRYYFKDADWKKPNF